MMAFKLPSEDNLRVFACTQFATVCEHQTQRTRRNKTQKNTCTHNRKPICVRACVVHCRYTRCAVMCSCSAYSYSHMLQWSCRCRRSRRHRLRRTAHAIVYHMLRCAARKHLTMVRFGALTSEKRTYGFVIPNRAGGAHAFSDSGDADERLQATNRTHASDFRATNSRVRLNCQRHNDA